MHTLKIRIPGRYWDSYLYSGRLYLFDLNGELTSLDWDRLISEWPLQDDDRLALQCAFQRSDYLYDREVGKLLRDPEVRDVMRLKFARLAQVELEADHRMIEKSVVGKQDNPCPFPHADVEIYNKNLYVGGKSGVFRATCDKRTKYPISTRPQKLWDGPALGLSASYGALALAAGDEGLHEIDLSHIPANHLEEPRWADTRPCHDCNWTFQSIYGSSYSGPGFLVAYRKERADDFSSRRMRREFEEVIPEASIFQGTGYSWGVQDKLCRADKGIVEVVRYQPWEEDPKEKLVRLGARRLARWKGDVVSASSATFGVVIECENALVIYPSRGEALTLRGEPANWRVFPRSKHYENQLHVIQEQHLVIYSFNHDYLVDQASKLFGTTFFPRRSRQAFF